MSRGKSKKEKINFLCSKALDKRLFYGILCPREAPQNTEIL
jgi:hypothetical protein